MPSTQEGDGLTAEVPRTTTIPGLCLPSSAAAAAKSLQSCPTLCNPIDGSPPGSPIPGILQARILEWVAISFSNAWKWKVKVKSLSHVRFFATPWTAPTRLLHPWDFPGKSTGVGCHCLKGCHPQPIVKGSTLGLEGGITIPVSLKDRALSQRGLFSSLKISWNLSHSLDSLEILFCFFSYFLFLSLRIEMSVPHLSQHFLWWALHIS